ncbi:MAG: hypothetical protein ACLQPD_28170 [Desulfomonilaceae bacterium]
MQANNNSPLQFACPVCGSHELLLVEAHIVYYTIVKVNESGELEYQPTPICIENDGNREDCYFACGGYHPDSNCPCDFIPNDPDNGTDDDPDNRISDDYTMLQWIKAHQQTPAAR